MLVSTLAHRAAAQGKRRWSISGKRRAFGPTKGTDVKKGRFLFVTLLVATAAMAYRPAEERSFGEIAASGCNNRDGDFIVRGMVSNATEDTVVLADPADEATTMSLSLPGRGPLARAKGFFSRSKYEATQKRLERLRSDHTPVVVTLKCRGSGTPAARNISYTNEDGSAGSITF